jgi:hypothetical protein
MVHFQHTCLSAFFSSPISKPSFPKTFVDPKRPPTPVIAHHLAAGIGMQIHYIAYEIVHVILIGFEFFATTILTIFSSKIISNRIIQKAYILVRSWLRLR